MRTPEPIPFEVADTLKQLGEHIRIARMRRQMRQDELADKCRISRKSLYNIESGSPGIAIGHLFSVLWALNLLDEAKSLANPDNDEHGKILEAAQRKQRVREHEPDNDF